jgi:hypothetical protein
VCLLGCLAGVKTDTVWTVGKVHLPYEPGCVIPSVGNFTKQKLSVNFPNFPPASVCMKTKPTDFLIVAHVCTSLSDDHANFKSLSRWSIIIILLKPGYGGSDILSTRNLTTVACDPLSRMLSV